MGGNFLQPCLEGKKAAKPAPGGQLNLFVLSSLRDEYIRMLCLRCKRLQSCGESGSGEPLRPLY
jgi:hypothetical protein